MDNEKIIKAILQLDDLSYGQMVWNYASVWLSRYFSSCPEMITAMENSKHFWKWWTNQWNIRNVEYLADTGFDAATRLTDQYTIDVAHDLYAFHHDPYKLIIVPNRMVVSEANRLLVTAMQKLKEL